MAGGNWLNEDSAVADDNLLVLRTTLEGEQEVARFTQAGGRGLVLRFAAFYSADAPSTTEMVSMARKPMLNQIGPAANYFSSIYVPDAAHAVAAAVNAPAGICKVSDDEPVIFAEFLRIMTSAIGAKSPSICRDFRVSHCSGRPGATSLAQLASPNAK